MSHREEERDLKIRRSTFLNAHEVCLYYLRILKCSVWISFNRFVALGPTDFFFNYLRYLRIPRSTFPSQIKFDNRRIVSFLHIGRSGSKSHILLFYSFPLAFCNLLVRDKEERERKKVTKKRFRLKKKDEKKTRQLFFYFFKKKETLLAVFISFSLSLHFFFFVCLPLLFFWQINLSSSPSPPFFCFSSPRRDPDKIFKTTRNLRMEQSSVKSRHIYITWIKI